MQVVISDEIGRKEIVFLTDLQVQKKYRDLIVTNPDGELNCWKTLCVLENVIDILPKNKKSKETKDLEKLRDRIIAIDADFKARVEKITKCNSDPDLTLDEEELEYLYEDDEDDLDESIDDEDDDEEIAA